MAIVTAFKCTRANGTDFNTGTFDYSKIGAELVQEGGAKGEPCGVGLHVSPTARMTCGYGNTMIDRGNWRWFQVEFDDANLLGRDATKFRVSRLRVIREVFKAEIFGEDLAKRVEGVRDEIASWKTIPWLNPPRPVTQEEIGALLGQWHDAITPFRTEHYKNVTMPRRARLVTDIKTAAAAAADADAAAYWQIWPYWARWYVRPRYVLWRAARWEIGIGSSKPNPWRPLVELMRLGCAPIGYATLPGIDNEVAFTVYVPQVAR